MRVALNVCVVSLSENRDQLSEWRAYSRPGDAYSIGWPLDLLERLAQDNDWRLVKRGTGHWSNIPGIRSYP